MDYHDKRDVKAKIAEALMTKPEWKVYGYKENTSDPMTDYYNPASWGGVALHQSGAVLCVDVYFAQDSSGKEITQEVTETKPCSHCLETGEEPGFPYTLETARQNPAEYHKVQIELEHGPNSGVQNLFNNVVSPIPFNGNGTYKCRKCWGKGSITSTVSHEKIDQWPTFTNVDKGYSWHIEKDGKIIKKGKGLNRLYRDHEAIETFIVDILAIINAGDAPITPSEPFTGTLEVVDYSEKAIAVFGDTKEVKDQLKSLGGRFNPHLKRNDVKEAGWIFSKRMTEKVAEFVSSVNQ